MQVFDPMVPTKFDRGEVVCFDVRKFDAIHHDYPDMVWDLKLIYGGKNLTFERLAFNTLGDTARPLWDLKEKVKAHLKAASASGIDVKTAQMSKLVDDELWKEYVEERRKIAVDLFVDKYEPNLTVNEIAEYSKLLEFRRALNIVEEAGIMVDTRGLEELADSFDPAIAAFASRAKKSLNGSYLETKFNANPGVTGRIGIESGFNALSIPHGAPRRVIVSRHAGGSIFVIDYNAMDFRSIIKMTEGIDSTTRASYQGCKDFHARTAELLFGDPFRRDEIKAFLYPLFYGGSLETVASKGGFSLQKAQEIDARFREKLPSVFVLKANLEEEARKFGSVKLPTNRKIKVDDSSKAFALAGQSLSSDVFRNALIQVVDLLKERCSKVIFTVHDEIVIDLHPSETDLVRKVEAVMREPIADYRYEVKSRTGRNYEEASA
jgi:hypothetical protein